MQEKERNKRWFESRIVERAVMGLLAAWVGGGDFVKDELFPEEKTGGNLTAFINGDMKEFKKWVADGFIRADEIDKDNYNELKTRLRFIERHIDREIGANNERLRIEEEHKEQSIMQDRQFIDEWYKGITLKRNMVTNKLYYDATNGKRYLVVYNNDHDTYYYVNERGLNIRCK